MSTNSSQLEQYQYDALRRFSNDFDFKGKTVLEVGGSNLPRDIVFGELGAAQWVCIDYLPTHFDSAKSAEHYKREKIEKLSPFSKFPTDVDYMIYDGKIEDMPKDFAEKFDAVVSITSLEHILNIPSALRAIHASLKKGASFFSYHGPIYSSCYGHHSWVSPEINFNTEAYPKWGHLLYSPPELYAHMRKKYGDNIAEQCINQVFFSERVNRLFYEDYVKFFEYSEFSTFTVTPYGETWNPPSVEMQRRLETLHPGYKQFSAYGMYSACKK